jgi:alpha/beta superfamily hydrolase
MKSKKDKKDLSEKLDLNIDKVALEGCEEDKKPQLVFDVLKKNKIELLTINFSGGGDSGGADDWTLTMGDGSDKSVDVDKFNIADICEKPIYDKYYGFAFNGSVSGSVVWNVSQRRIYISGTETMDDSETKEYEL